MRRRAWVTRSLAFGALLAVFSGACSSNLHPGAAATKPSSIARTSSSGAHALVTKPESLAAINAACANFYRLDPPDLADAPSLAAAQTYSRGRLQSISGALAIVGSIPLSPQDERLRQRVRSNFLAARAIYEQIIALPPTNGDNPAGSLLGESQRLVVETAVDLIDYGATSCIPASSPKADPPGAGAGPVVDLAPAAVIKVTTPLLSDDYVSVDSTAVWVGMSRGHAIARIDPRTNSVVKRLDVGTEIANPMVLQDGGLWVETATEILRIDEATTKITERIPMAGLAPPKQGFAIQGSTLLLCDGNVVHRLDVVSKRRGADVSVGGACQSILPAGESVYVLAAASLARGIVERIDAATGRVEGSASTPTPGSWSALRTPAGHIVVDGLPGLRELDVAAGRPVAEVVRNGHPGANIIYAGGAVWAARPSQHRVVRWDARTHRLQEFVAGAGATGLAYLDGWLWVTNSDDGTLSRFRVDPWPFSR